MVVVKIVMALVIVPNSNTNNSNNGIVKVRVVQSDNILLPKQELPSTCQRSVSVRLTDLRRRFFISKHLPQHAAWAHSMKVSQQEGPLFWRCGALK